MFGFDRITSDPNVLGGKACIRGMRISVALVVNLVAHGMSVEEIVGEYPDLEPEDIQQALCYAAWASEDVVPSRPVAHEEIEAPMSRARLRHRLRRQPPPPIISASDGF
jgi:uncharacterized protein (DUF433 family)